MLDRTTFLKQIIGEAAKLVKSMVPSEGVSYKSDGSFATAADFASEKLIMQAIQKEFPGDKILSEETAPALQDVLAIDRLWVIDPIDGTNNFRNQRFYSAISIGYIEKGIPQLGGIYDIYRDILYFAEKGKGAYVGKEKLHIGKQASITDANIATDQHTKQDVIRRNLSILLSMNPIPWLIMKGSATLMMCEIAAGKTDLYFHTGLMPWDNAAGSLIVQEAGGVVRGLDGEPVSFTSPEIVIGNEALVKQFVALVDKQ